MERRAVNNLERSDGIIAKSVGPCVGVRLHKQQLPLNRSRSGQVHIFRYTTASLSMKSDVVIFNYFSGQHKLERSTVRSLAGIDRRALCASWSIVSKRLILSNLIITCFDPHVD